MGEPVGKLPFSGQLEYILTDTGDFGLIGLAVCISTRASCDPNSAYCCAGHGSELDPQRVSHYSTPEDSISIANRKQRRPRIHGTNDPAWSLS
jgi:hypothetical protein